MKQEEFNKILLKYEAGRRAEKERRRAELRHKNLKSAKEIANPAQSKTRIFENINAGLNLKKEEHWQRMEVGITAVLLPPPPPPPRPPPPHAQSRRVAADPGLRHLQ